MSQRQVIETPTKNSIRLTLSDPTKRERLVQAVAHAQDALRIYDEAEAMRRRLMREGRL